MGKHSWMIKKSKMKTEKVKSYGAAWIQVKFDNQERQVPEIEPIQNFCSQ